MSPRWSSAVLAIGSLSLGLVTLAQKQTAAAGDAYPAVPSTLSDSAEIALAMTGAPAEISGAASIYAIRHGRDARIRDGTNGCSCMVSRDLHKGSLYPICFDAEGTRTRLHRELMELRLRMAGDSEAVVKQKVEEAYRAGALRMPTAMSVTYMMSPKQVLFSSPFADGRRVGAWWPHLMIMGPGLSSENLGLAASSKVTTFTVGPVAAGHATELVVKLPAWSDGTPVRPDR